MNLKAALLGTATAAAFLLVPACGGEGGASDSAQSQPNSETTQSQSSSSTAQSQPASGTIAKYVVIDLNCSACSGAVGSGIGDGEQVGNGRISGDSRSHALLWRG